MAVRKTGAVAVGTRNYQGRFIYLETLQEHWPDLLETLASECLQQYREGTGHCGQGSPRNFRELQSRSEFRSQRLQTWLERYSIRDDWMLDAVVQTLNYLANAAESPRWVYAPPDLPIQKFELRVEAAWIPPLGLAWADFSKQIHQQVTTELEKYRKDVSKVWGEDRRSQNVHALWTVWWQQGLTSGAILLKGRRLGQPKTTGATIHTSIGRFARSIGLSLRVSKVGRARRN